MRTADTPAPVNGTTVRLFPVDLLSPQGFLDGGLCDQIPGILGVKMPTKNPDNSRYAQGRHLLRHLIRKHLLPSLPCGAETAYDQNHTGPPVKLWLFDSEGCPMRSTEKTITLLPPVCVEEAEVKAAIREVYPLTRACEVGMYEALLFPDAAHEAALDIVGSFQTLHADIIGLAVEIYENQNSKMPFLTTLPYTGTAGERMAQAVEIAALVCK